MIDNTHMSNWAYDSEFVGNLVNKVPLATGRHVASVSYDRHEQIACCYEERGFGYVVLPALKQKQYKVHIKTGPEPIFNCVVNNGTYNVNCLDIKPETVSFALEMYGTQDSHLRLVNFQPRDAKSRSNDLVINFWNWDEQARLCVVNVTGVDRRCPMSGWCGRALCLGRLDGY